MWDDQYRGKTPQFAGKIANQIPMPDKGWHLQMKFWVHTQKPIHNLLERLQYLGFPITCPNMFLEIELHDCKHFTEFLKDGGLKLHQYSNEAIYLSADLIPVKVNH